MDFSKALTELKMGARIRQKGWTEDAFVKMADNGKGAYFQNKYKIGGEWLDDVNIMAEDWEIASPNGGVECACDSREKCDDPVGDKILHDIIKSGFSCEYIMKDLEEKEKLKMENDIAIAVSEKIAQVYRGAVVTVLVQVKANFNK